MKMVTANIKIKITTEKQEKCNERKLLLYVMIKMSRSFFYFACDDNKQLWIYIKLADKRICITR